MILSIDIGNTITNCGLFEDDKIILQVRCATNTNLTSDEIGLFLRDALRENGFDWRSVTKIGCCSVVPSVNYSWASACTKYLGHEPLFIQAGIKTGLKLKYPNPKEIGADLIAAAMGAVNLYPKTNLIIVDMGTATTLEIVTKEKEFLGGTIMPGLKISVNALANGTAKLPSVEIAKPVHSCGTNTIEAIQSGLYYGTLGSIKEICYQYQKSNFDGNKAYIIGTGGFSKIFSENNLFDEIVPELVLLGVKCAIEMNM